MAQRLPRGWCKVRTPEGRLYYANVQTRESRWTPPLASSSVPRPQRRAPTAPGRQPLAAFQPSRYPLFDSYEDYEDSCYKKAGVATTKPSGASATTPSSSRGGGHAPARSSAVDTPPRREGTNSNCNNQYSYQSCYNGYNSYNDNSNSALTAGPVRTKEVCAFDGRSCPWPSYDEAAYRAFVDDDGDTDDGRDSDATTAASTASVAATWVSGDGSSDSSSSSRSMASYRYYYSKTTAGPSSSRSRDTAPAGRRNVFDRLCDPAGYTGVQGNTFRSGRGPAASAASSSSKHHGRHKKNTTNNNGRYSYPYESY